MENTPSAPKPVSLAELEEITCSFSEHRKLGGGAYGIVYLGEYKDGEKIAVKVLKEVLDLDDEKFEKEYENLASLHHKNVVRLVSYCNETKGEHVQYNGVLVSAEKIWRVLCFEYMCKGSLDKFIFDESNERNWSTRYAIIKGICEGLEYLHEKLNPPMYHLDLKPANILLDESMSPKIADFGLSRLFIEQRTKQTNSSLGTRGYIPPEYIDAGLISIKFDIFSLGVVIIKMMTGQDGYFRPAEISSQQFADDVHTDWMNRLQGMSMNVYSIQVRRCIEIALSCVEAGRHKRPSIGVIINNLCRTESMIQILDALRNTWTSQADICPCISNETGMLDILENNMISYPLRVTDNRGRVHQATITTIGDPACDTSTSEIIDCTGDLGYSSQIREENFGYVCTVDVHPTEPWILVGHYSGHVSAWNHRTQKILMGLRIVNTGERTISAVRFIPQKQWFVAGDSNGHIHVCITAPDNVKKFQAHASCINSLAVHPIDPFVLSSSDDHLIKLWNWENEECIRTFQAHSKEVESVKFNPLTTSNTFASASRDGTIKIWSIHSDTPITTLECEAELTSVHYLSLPGSHQHIVTGSSCGTARIWDLEEETCIQNISGLQKEWCSVAVVDCLPGYPIFVTVSEDHIVSCCNSSTHRYQNLVDFKLGLIMDFAYIKDTQSLLVAGQRGIALLKID